MFFSDFSRNGGVCRYLHIDCMKLCDAAIAINDLSSLDTRQHRTSVIDYKLA
jgi:hypothetical protein